MKITAAQHQREVDEAAELEHRAEELKQDARETLSKMNRFDFLVMTKHGLVASSSRSSFDVMEEMDSLCRDEVELAFSQLDSDPLEAVRILKEARDKAVRHVLGMIDFEEVAKAELELQRREVA